MKRPLLPLTTAISAAILAACGSSSRPHGADSDWQTDSATRVCADSDGKRLPDDQCAQPSSARRWYYISRGGYVPYYYGALSGGSYSPVEPAANYHAAPSFAPAGAVTRGGFGGSAVSHGGEGAGE